MSLFQTLPANNLCFTILTVHDRLVVVDVVFLVSVNENDVKLFT